MAALRVKTEQEVDGRWIAEVPSVPGALAYGSTRIEAIIKAFEIAGCVLARKETKAD